MSRRARSIRRANGSFFSAGIGRLLREPLGLDLLRLHLGRDAGDQDVVGNASGCRGRGLSGGGRTAGGGRPPGSLVDHLAGRCGIRCRPGRRRQVLRGGE